MLHPANDRMPDERIPPALHRPACLGWLWILPQMLLCLLNLRDFFLVRGEMTVEQFTRASYVGAAELGLLAAGCVMLLVLRLQNRPITLRLCVPILLVHTAYLWWFVAGINALLPRTVTMWLLPVPRVLYTQFALVMPILFYALLRLAGYAVPWSRRRDFALTFSALLGCALPWTMGSLPGRLYNSSAETLAWCLVVMGVLLPFFLAARATLPVRLRRIVTVSVAAIALGLTSAALVGANSDWRWHDRSEWVVLAGVFLLALAFMLHVLRLLIGLSGWLMTRGPTGRTLVAALVGLAGPLGGLFLNRHIPFPADYQSVAVYGFVLVNAAVLLLPQSSTRPRALATWLLQALLFPFTLYFFVVFLPFLPLALLAIMVAGAGFLVLAPTALFLFHGQQLLTGLRFAQLAWGPRNARLALAAALAVLPLALATTALVDRVGLRQAMHYVFEPAYSQASFTGSRALVRRTLTRMVDARDGRRLPMLSGCYNRIVFGGLVLPDHKLRLMQEVFFGGPLPSRSKSGALAELFGQPQRGAMDEISGNASTLQTFAGPAATLADLTLQSEAAPGCVRTLLTLTVANAHPAQAEFVAGLHVPSDVLVSGLWLYIDNVRVPGQLFEKQAAMWVYRMITSSRRDPALLIYTAPETAELRVFPVEPQLTRVVEIELLHPRGRAATLQIGARTIDLPALGSTAGAAFATEGDGSGSFLIVDQSLPALVREPYLHIVVDQSAAVTNAEPVAERVRAALAPFPEIRTCVVTFANYEFAEPAGVTPRPVDEVLAILDQDAEQALAPRGGFCRDRAIQRALTLRAAYLDAPDTPDAARLQAPVFVVVPAGGVAIAADDGGLAWFRDLAPDFPYYYEVQAGGVTLHAFAGQSRPEPALPPKLAPVVLLQCEQQCAVLPQTGGLWHVNRLKDEAAPVWRIYKPDEGRFAAWPSLASIPPGAYRQGLDVWAEYIRLRHDPEQSPAQWPEVVLASKAVGVLVPATAWIAVENSAQWRMLERKESQKLRQAEALAFRSVPDQPNTLALLALGALALAGARWQQRRWRAS